jgi:hypothetical protein
MEIKKNEIVGLTELIEKNTPLDKIYIFGGVTCPDWGLHDQQAFTRDEALEMFGEWWEVDYTVDHWGNIAREKTREQYVDDFLKQLSTADEYEIV